MSNNMIAVKQQEVAQIADQQKSYIQSRLRDENEFVEFKRNVLAMINSNPMVAQCTAKSILGSAIDAIRMNLSIEPMKAECFINTRKTKDGATVAVLEPMYKGLMKLARQAGVVDFRASLVYEGEHFEAIDKGGAGWEINYRPNFNRKGKSIVAGYCVALMANGSTHIEIMGIDELDTIKNSYSKGADNKFSPYNQNTVSRDEMYKKTLIKRCCKMLPLSTDLQSAVAYDEAVSFGKVPEYHNNASTTFSDGPQGGAQNGGGFVKVSNASMPETAVSIDQNSGEVINADIIANADIAINNEENSLFN